MKRSIAAAAILAPLAAAFAAAAAGSARSDEAAASAWIVEARRQARPAKADEAPAVQAPDDQPIAADAPVRDPFGLDLEQARADFPANGRNRRATSGEEDNTPPPDAPYAPSIRLVGTLVRASDAYAVLKIDGATHRVRAGDALPGDLGRVLQIRENAVELSGSGAARLVAIDDAPTADRPASAPAPAASGKPGRPGKRRLIRAGTEA